MRANDEQVASEREDAVESADAADTRDGAALPAGYSVRAATPDDAAAVAALRSAYQADEGDPTVVAAEEQINDWQGVNLAEDTVLIFASDGSLAAHADVFNRRYIQVSIYGGVHPQHRRRGLGAYLTRWGAVWTRARMDRAPADAEITIQHYVNTRNEQACALMERLGYGYAHTIYVMRIEMDEPPPAPERIAGIRIRAFRPGQDERATFEAVEEAFRDIRGRPPGDFARWLTLTENERRDPGHWLLTEDEARGEPAGVCLAKRVPGHDSYGWVGSFGVRREWRRHGLALALLLTAFGEFYRQGVRVVELSVDAGSPTSAPRLYSRAGMQVAQSISLYRRRLRPGRDYSTLPKPIGE